MKRLVALSLLIAAATCPVAAQDSSSWTSDTLKAPKDRPGEAKILKRDPAKPALKPTLPPAGNAVAKGVPPPVAPGDLSTFKLPAPSADPATQGSGALANSSKSSDIAKTGQGDDPAYEAYSLGRYLTAVELAQKAAEKGEAPAHTLMGLMLQEGLGVAQDNALAAQWYRRGAELGDVEAMFAFGVMLADGLGIQKNRPGAAQMFEEAARRGHALANYNLALLFLKGDGKPENPRRAYAHLRFAADADIAAAQYDLATLYATGTGVDPNAFEAARWLWKAASAGHTDAEVEYGVWLFQGRGVEPDQAKGASYFRSAAEKGAAVAQNRLARCYAFGAGVKADLGEAAKWYFLARAAGLEDPKLADLIAKLPRADRAKAEAAAAEWREQAPVR